jgi:hypothetical protein
MVWQRIAPQGHGQLLLAGSRGMKWNGESVKELEGLPIANLADIGLYKLGNLDAGKETALYIM